MMGKQNLENELFAYNVNLAGRVSEDHKLRKVKEFIDFLFVRDEVKEFYGQNGNVSVDPVVIMKMMFLMFFDAVKSERELMEIIPYRID